MPISFSKHVKSELLSTIDEMNSVSWMYSKNHEVDFSRIRKMDFKSTLRFILSLESSNLKTELFKYFKFNQTTPSMSKKVEYIEQEMYSRMILKITEK